MTKQSKVEFTPPKGSVPEGKSAGDEFDVVCTFQVKPDGSVCLTMFGDTEMPGYDDKDERPSYKGYTDSMMAAGNGGGGNAPETMGET